MILGLSVGYISFGLSMVALIPLLLMTTRHTVGFFLVMYGGPLGGVTRALYPILPIYGIFLEFLGFILLWDIILDLLKKHSRHLVAMLVVLSLFGIFYMLGPMDDFSSNKYLTMISHGILMVAGYFAFDRSSKIDAEGLTRILIVASICMYAFCISYYKLTPGNFFDYNWFRVQSLAHFYSTKGEHMLVGYQHIGMLLAFAVAIILSKTDIKFTNALYYIICASQLVLVSGCRQAIFAVAIIIGLRYAIFRSKNVSKKISFDRIVGISIALITAFLFIFLLLENVGSTVIEDTISEGDSDRNMLFIEALSIFKNNMMLGAGIGGYNAITGEGWPHNLFLELLCETGLIGTIVFLFIVIVTLYRKHIHLLYITCSDMFYFLVLLTMFVRVMVSSDLGESIEVFSAVFAVGASRKIRSYC